MPHRPNFLVSKNNATRKLFHAIARGNINSATRQIRRGANITAKMKNQQNKNVNLYNIINSKYPNDREATEWTSVLETRKRLIRFLKNSGFNTKPKENAANKAWNEERERFQQKLFEMVMESRKRNREYVLQRRKEEKEKKEKRIKTLQNLARKRLSNMNSRMTYTNGKPEGLSIRIPKNRTRRVHFENNSIPVK